MTFPRNELAAVILAAGMGSRLLPLTRLLPKALCPVDNVPLVDSALSRALSLTPDVAINMHHMADIIRAHVAGRAYLSEERQLLGTAGALGHLRPWIGGRDVVLLNVDAWTEFDLPQLASGWDRERARLLVVKDPRRGDFGPYRYAGAALLPWELISGLDGSVQGLSDVVWGTPEQRARLDLVPTDEAFFDCGTVDDYLAANMYASGGRNVLGPGARIYGRAERCVLWRDTVVLRDESLVNAVRASADITVMASR